jgi:hypothetical protein
MPVINNRDLEKYKYYYTERVKGKDGITRPLTKVGYKKPCTLCGGDMALDKFRKGGVHKSSFIRWKCPDVKCNYSEREPSYFERLESDEFLT